MSKREHPLIQQMRAFCKHWLGRDCFAPFTGQDASGWSAFVHLCELWGRGDYVGRSQAIIAMRAALAAVQNKYDVHRVFIQTIPGVLDWTHTKEIWPQLGSPFDVWPRSEDTNTANYPPLRSVP